MPIFIAIGLSAVVGTIVAVQARRWPAADPAAAATDAGGANMRGKRVSRFVRRRLDPATATGLALTVSLLIAVVAGAAVGLLFYLLRTHPRPALSQPVGRRWGARQ